MLHFLTIAIALLLAATALAQDSKSPFRLTPEQAKNLRLQQQPDLKSIVNTSRKRTTNALDVVRGQLTVKDFEAKEMAAIRSRVADPNYVGVVAVLGEKESQISLEKRVVITELGPRNLVLSKLNGVYIYDGDLIVPQSAILPLEVKKGKSVAEEVREKFPGARFSAGYPGRFGKGLLWDDGILPYEFSDDFCCREEVEQVARDLRRVSIIRLVPREGHENYIRFINSEPLLSSMTELGKQQGKNDVRIKGFLDDGSELDRNSRIGTIKHEIGHELGLIHEHLRRDRDRFVARNPNCSPTGIWEYVRQGWVDLTQSAFADDNAELLTRYDKRSVMHYSGLISQGDGNYCNSLVDLDTCNGRNPSAADCKANFGGDDYTASDLIGIHKIYIKVPGAAERLPNSDEMQTFSGDNVRLRGKFIDRCEHGLPPLTDGCAPAAVERVAKKFCQENGFREAFGVLHRSLVGIHSGLHAVEGWKTVWGGDVISSVSCRLLTKNARAERDGTLRADDFRGADVRINGRHVDRCLHGDGIVGDRCSEVNQKRVANEFCKVWGYDESDRFTTDGANFGVEINATGFDMGQNKFRDVSGFDVFQTVHCIKTPAVVDNTRFFASGTVKLNGNVVDRCVHGTGFGVDRCTNGRQRLVARQFCREKGFDDVDSFLTAFSPNLWGKGFNVESNSFEDVGGIGDVISSATCKN